MKRVYTAIAAACTLVLVHQLAPAEQRPFLLAAASAAALLTSTTVIHSLPALRRLAGWNESRYTLLTLGVLSASCFASTTATTLTRPAIHYTALLLAVNTYLLARLVAEATVLRRLDGGMASAAVILGALSYLVYLVSVWEAFRL
ncbi:MAG: hypothetical protein QXY50_00890 [Candidatus Caldarchaeum sp.]